MRLTRATLVLGAMLASASARAEWKRTLLFDDKGTPIPYSSFPVGKLNAVGAGVVAGNGNVWAVGGNLTTSSFILSSTDGFANAAEVTDCAATTKTSLNAIWVKADATSVLAFGNSKAYDSWNGSWACGLLTTPAPNLTVLSAAMADASTGYLGGSKSPGPSYLGKWTGTNNPSDDFNNALGSIVAFGRASTSGHYVYSSVGQLFREDLSTAFYSTGATQFTAISFFGDSGIAVGNPASGSVLVDGATKAVVAAGAMTNLAKAYGISLTQGGFAIAVGTNDDTHAAINQSIDGGAHWTGVDLSGITAPLVLRAVNCWDWNHCAAVGGNDGQAIEILYYVNQPPDATITVNGLPYFAPMTIDGAVGNVCLVANASDVDGDPFTLVWTGPAPVGGDTTPSPSCVSTSACDSQKLDFTLTLTETDGRILTPTVKNVSVQLQHNSTAPSLLPISPPPDQGNTYKTWKQGETHVLTANSTKDTCSSGVTYLVPAPTGNLPAPTIQGDQLTFDLKSFTCEAVNGSFDLSVKDNTTSMSSAPTTFTVDIAPIVALPDVSVVPPSPIHVPPNSTVPVTASATHCSGSSPSDFTFDWACQPTNHLDTASFTNANPACSSSPSCDLTVTPVAQPQSAATTPILVILDGTTDPGQVTFAYSPAGNTGMTLSDGQSVTVTPQVTNLCSPTTVWTCTGVGAPTPPANSASWKFTNTLAECQASEHFNCTVTATGSDSRNASASFELFLDPPGSNTSVKVDFTPSTTQSPVPVAPGDSVKVDVTASNSCTATIALAWSCTGPVHAPSDGTTTYTFMNTNPTCFDENEDCTITATPAGYLPVSAPVSIDFQAPQQFVTSVTIDNLDFDATKGIVTATAGTKGGCGNQTVFHWTAWLDSDPQNVFTPTKPDPTLEYAPPLCGKDTAQVRVVETNSGLGDSRSIAVDGAQTKPTIDASSQLDYSPEVACDAPSVITLRPAVTARCNPVWTWTQVSADAGPIIPLRTSGGTGSLDIDLDPTELAALLGTSAQFQLVVSNQAGDSNPALFNVAFEPTKFVHLAHHADRGAAKVGEPISFSLSVSTNCAVAMDSVVDLRLSLSGLEFVSGSATYGGAFVDNPDHEGGELVFKSISVPSRSEMPRVLTYVARRRSATAGNATSRALAYLSRDPSKLVSDSGETGSGTVGDAMPALSCECSSGAGVASWLGVAAALSLVRRRRKRC